MKKVMELEGAEIMNMPNMARYMGFQKHTYNLINIPDTPISDGLEFIANKPSFILLPKEGDIKIHTYASTIIAGEGGKIIVDSHAPLLLFRCNIQRLDAYLRNSAHIEGENIGQTNVVASSNLELNAVNMREFNGQNGWHINQEYHCPPQERKGLVYFNGGGKGRLMFEYDNDGRLDRATHANIISEMARVIG
jgi:hypothetical protein